MALPAYTASDPIEGVSPIQIANRVEALTGKAFRDWELARREGHDYLTYRQKGAQIGEYLVHAVATIGGKDEECPRCNSVLPYHYTFTRGDETRNLSELQIHNLKVHNSCQRFDPVALVKFLGLQSGVDYSPEMATEKVWEPTRPSPVTLVNEGISIAPGATAYILGQNGLIVSDKRVLMPKAVEMDGSVFLLLEIMKGKTWIRRVEQKYVK